MRGIEGIPWSRHVTNEELKDYVLAGQKLLRRFGDVLRLPLNYATRTLEDFDPAATGWRRLHVT